MDGLVPYKMVIDRHVSNLNAGLGKKLHKFKNYMVRVEMLLQNLLIYMLINIYLMTV